MTACFVRAAAPSEKLQIDTDLCGIQLCTYIFSPEACRGLPSALCTGGLDDQDDGGGDALAYHSARLRDANHALSSKASIQQHLHAPSSACALELLFL